MQFFGRTGQEYESMFMLPISSMHGLDVLDCPSGPSSFVAESRAAGVHSVGVDPLYEDSLETLLSRGASDVEHTITRMKRDAQSFVDIDLSDYQTNKLHALARFAMSYEKGRAAGWYLPASLPKLPFQNGQFDLTLSAHLLFTYSSQETGGVLSASPFTFEWHLAAGEELLRVTRGELRLYPTTTRWRKPTRHPYAEAMAARFCEMGLKVRYQACQFARGNHVHDDLNACMVVTR